MNSCVLRLNKGRERMNLIKLHGLLGLARRQGLVHPGLNQAVDALRRGQAILAFIDESAGKNAQKRMSDTCNTYGVNLHELPKNVLSKALGMDNLLVVSLAKGTLTRAIQMALNDNNEPLGGNDFE
jgi:ribosomal protein L7Ae-like RNA K-turn-binding protein